MKKIILLTCLLLIFNCQIPIENNSQYNYILHTNISERYETYSNLYLDTKNIFLVGSDKDQTIYYELIDTHFLKWKLHVIKKLKGQNLFFEAKHNDLYFLNESKKNKYLYYLNKLNDSVTLIKSFQNTAIYFFYTDFQNDSFYAIINKKNEGGGYNSKNTKLIWFDSNGIKKSISINSFISNAQFFLNKIYFSVSKNTIISINTKTFEQNSIKIDEKYKLIDYKVVTNDDCILLLKDKNNYLVIKRYTNGNWKTISTIDSEKNNSGKELYVYNNYIAILLSDIDKKALFGLGAARYSLLISKDKGRQWEKYRILKNNRIRPHVFIKDDFFIAYSGDGELTLVNFKK